MKSKEEIQKMHDVMTFLSAHPLILRGVASKEDRERIHGAANMLCWVLGHNDNMNENLDEVLIGLKAVFGITIEFIQDPKNATKINGRPHLN